MIMGVPERSLAAVYRIYRSVVGAVFVTVLFTSCKNVEVTRTQRSNPQIRKEARQAKREAQILSREQAENRKVAKGFPGIARRFEKDLEEEHYRKVTPPAEDGGTEVAEVVPRDPIGVDEPAPRRRLLEGEPDPAPLPPEDAEPPPTTTRSEARSSWLPDGRCYFCSGRGMKFIEAEFQTCPHCEGKGRR